MFNKYDSILNGITFDDLITAVQSNVENINKSTVKQVFNEIWKSQMEDAKYILDTEMENIIKNCK